MQYVSNEYKEAMSQPFRKITYMRISLGLINQDAQASAQVISGPFTYYADIQKPLLTERVSKVYATLENDFGRVDRSQYFLPRQGSRLDLYNQGIVTEELCGLGDEPCVYIIFDMADPLDIKGITLELGECYPSKLRIETDEEDNIYDVTGPKFETEDTFNNTTFIKIYAEEMVNDIGRLRINNITFGLGIVFENDKIISTEFKGTISPVSEGLPSIDFNMQIENMDRYYNVDNEDSAINYMETGQKVTLFYGQTLENNSIEWVKGGTLYMKEWKADDKTANFEAVDAFQYMNDDYKKGKYRPEGITLYDLAEDVFEDAGVDPETYWIDPYLRTITVYNPLPTVKHKECLQLIANAARSVIFQSREGIIMIKSSFEPEKSVAANQVAEYGSVEHLLEGDDYNEYASFEQEYGKVDRSQFFIPRGHGPFIDVGYVSESISGADGTFSSNPIITLTMESAYTFYNLTLLFGSIQPVEFIVTTYNDGVKKKSFKSKGISEKTIVYYDFIDTDKITIEFTKGKPHNRIHLKRIVFGEQSDYHITYEDLFKTPVGTKLEKIKELRVVRTIYTPGTELKDLTTEEKTLEANVQAEYEISFAQAVHNLSVVTTIENVEVDYGATITESSSYWCKVKITRPPASDTDVTMTIKGYEYNISTILEPITLNNAGSIMSWNNPLISSLEEAKDLAEWIGLYYKGANKYELSYRGDPILDTNDLVFLESHYVDDLMIRLEEVGLSFSGSIKGTLVGRRKV